MNGEAFEKIVDNNSEKPYVSLKRCRMLRSGVQLYGRDEIPDFFKGKIPDKEVYRVFRKPEAIVKHVKDFNYLYFTNGHPKDEAGCNIDVTPDNANMFAAGRIGGNAELKVLDDGNVYVENDVVFDSKDAYKDYLDGKVEMSIGLTALWRMSDSKAYDLEVYDFSAINHCALVPAGRAGHKAKIIDSGGIKMNGLFSFFNARKNADAEKRKVFDAVSALCDKVSDSSDEDLKRIVGELADATFGEPDKKGDDKKGEDKKDGEKKNEEEQKDEGCGGKAEEKSEDKACGDAKDEKALTADEIKAIVKDAVAQAVKDEMTKSVNAQVEKSVKDALGVGTSGGKVNDNAIRENVDFDLPQIWGR